MPEVSYEGVLRYPYLWTLVTLNLYLYTTFSSRISLEILYYGKRWMLGSLIQLATQGIETQLHINPPIVSYRIGLSG